jgi:hypothetical protein
MSPRWRRWLGLEVKAPRRGVILGAMLLVVAVVSALVGNVLSAAICGAGVVLILVLYLFTYGPARPSPTVRSRRDE